MMGNKKILKLFHYFSTCRKIDWVSLQNETHVPNNRNVDGFVSNKHEARTYLYIIIEQVRLVEVDGRLQYQYIQHTVIRKEKAIMVTFYFDDSIDVLYQSINYATTSSITLAGV